MMTTDPKMPEPVAYASSDSRSFVSADTKRLNLGSAWAHFYDVSLITTESALAYAEALAAAWVAQERERCARLCSAIARGWKENPGDNPMAGYIAASNCEHEIRRAYVHLPDTQPPETGKEQK